MFIVQQYSLQNENQQLGLCAALQQKRKGRKQLLFWRDFYLYTRLVYYMAIYFALQTVRCCAMVVLPLAERLWDYSFSHLVASCTPELQRWLELNFVCNFMLEETFEVNTLKHMRNSLWGRTRSTDGNHVHHHATLVFHLLFSFQMHVGKYVCALSSGVFQFQQLIVFSEWRTWLLASW